MALPGSWTATPASLEVIEEFQREVAVVDLFGRPGHEHAPVGPHLDDELAAGQFYRDGGRALAGADQRDRGRGGAGAAGARLPHAPLPDPDLGLVLAEDLDELHVGLTREVLVLLDHGAHFVQRDELERPRRLDHGVRVADVDEREREAAAGGVQGLLDALSFEAAELLAAEARDAHVDGDHVALAERGDDLAGCGLEHHGVVAERALHTQLAGDHAHAVAAHLRLAAVGIEDRDREAVRAGRRADDHDAVRADAEVAVAEQAHALRRELERHLFSVHHDVVVAKALPLGELDLAEALARWRHPSRPPVRWKGRSHARLERILYHGRASTRASTFSATASGGRPAAGTWAAAGSLRSQVSWRRPRCLR